MKVCGSNKYYGLGEKSNKDTPFEPCISPPLLSHINIPALRSYSIFDNHAVLITKEGRAFAIGSNENGQIIDTIDKDSFEEEQSIEIKDEKGYNCQFISAVCGHDYTLYLVNSESSLNNQLAYVYANENSGHPLFLNINGHNPIYLFGGWKTAAAVDNEGGIFVITRSVFRSPENSIERSFLPNGEKAVSIACCNSFVVVSSSTGRVFGSSLEAIEIGGFSKLEFTPVSELEGKEIVEVSGTVENCIAVSRDGQIFGLGSNEWGQIGLGKRRTLTSKFTQIQSSKDHKIVSASSGCFHSLFLTSQGKVLATGNNGCGQLILKKGPSKDFSYLPVETTIKSGCTFCIAGNNVSAVFVDCEAPRNTPNQAIREAKRAIIGTRARGRMTVRKGWIEEQAEENAQLKQENNELKKIVAKLENENAKQAEKIRNFEDESERQDEIINQCEDENNIQNKEIFKLRDENSDQKEKIRSLEEENRIKSRIVEQLKEKNLLLSKKITQIQQESSLKSTAINQLQDRNSPKSAIIDILKEENSKQRIEINKLQVENSSKGTEIDQLRNEYLSQKVELEKIQKENSMQNILINQLQDENMKQKEELENLQNEYLSQKTELTKLEKEKSNQSTAISQLVEENRKQRMDIFKLQKENSSQKDEINQMKDKNTSSNQENVQLSLYQIIGTKDANRINLQIVNQSPNDQQENGAISIHQNLILKEINISNIGYDNLQIILNQYQKLKNLSHPNIIHTHGILFGNENKPLSILLEDCKSNITREIENSNLSKVDVAKSIYEIAEGMKYIHKNGLIHRNLRPSKILIGNDNLIKISDFYFSEIIENDNDDEIDDCHQIFLAPEIVNEDKCNEKVDVYSFGVLMYFILSGGKMPKIAVMPKEKIPAGFTKFSRDLVNKCWCAESNARPSFDDIIKQLKENEFKVVELTEEESNEIQQFARIYDSS